MAITEVKYPTLNFDYIWASEGGVKKPEPSQILSGWGINQFPPSEAFNYIQNNYQIAVNNLFQSGIAQWNEATPYIGGKSFIQKGGKVYLAVNANIGKDPETEKADWSIAFDSYGSAEVIGRRVDDLIGIEGELPLYVSKNFPVMAGNVKAPSYQALSGTNSGRGYVFSDYLNSGMFCNGGDLLFKADNKIVGRLPKTEVTLESDGDSLVTVKLLKQLYDSLLEKTRIPVGWTVITKSSKPPSDPSQLGYGTWVLDVQGRSLVGVSQNSAVSQPEWTKDVDSVFGEYEHRLIEEELPKLTPKIRLGDAVTTGELDTISSGGGLINLYDRQSFPVIGGDKPHNIVQPSQTKFLWTRTA